MSIPIYNEKESFADSKFGDFYLSSYQDEKNEHVERVEAHRHTYFEIVWVMQGKGFHTIDFEKYEFSGPCLFLLHPKNIHSITKQGESQGGVLKFNTNFFYGDNDENDFILKYGVFDGIDKLPVINLTDEETDIIKSLFDRMLQEYKSDTAFAATSLVAYLKIFLLEIFEIKKKHVEKSCFQQVDFIRYRKFLHLLDINFKTHQNVSFYADHLKVSSRTLGSLVKKFTGNSSQDLIKERLLLEAKRLLFYGEHSVKEVAYILNFQDAAYFNRFFSKNTATTPINSEKVSLKHPVFRFVQIIKLKKNLYEIMITPKFGIGQRAFLVVTKRGNVLWDCISLLDQGTVDFIKKLGGLRAIAISHPRSIRIS